ncbi:unnamed protein product [Amoebophrya sp. A120]|nr:unnamed protein product [Amoebophrya sp. A120]|eukprot:GSA120T00020589001.1
MIKGNMMRVTSYLGVYSVSRRAGFILLCYCFVAQYNFIFHNYLHAPFNILRADARMPKSWQNAVYKPIRDAADDHGFSRWPSLFRDAWDFSPYKIAPQLRNLTVEVVDLLTVVTEPTSGLRERDEIDYATLAAQAGKTAAHWQHLLPAKNELRELVGTRTSGDDDRDIRVAEQKRNMQRAPLEQAPDTSHPGRLRMKTLTSFATSLWKFVKGLVLFWHRRCKQHIGRTSDSESTTSNGEELHGQQLQHSASDENLLHHESFRTQAVPQLERHLEDFVAQADAATSGSRVLGKEEHGGDYHPRWTLLPAFARSYFRLFRHGCVRLEHGQDGNGVGGRDRATTSIGGADNIAGSTTSSFCEVHSPAVLAKNLFFQSCVYPLVLALHMTKEALTGWVDLSKFLFYASELKMSRGLHKAGMKGELLPTQSSSKITHSHDKSRKRKKNYEYDEEVGLIPGAQLIVPWKGHHQLGARGLASAARWSQLLRVAQEKLQVAENKLTDFQAESPRPTDAFNLARSISVEPAARQE